jgi:transcriptional regulator with XRE-family HTH domain
MTTQEQIERLTEVLKTLLRFSKVRNREIETQLGFSGGYMSRLLSGKIDIKISHLLDIARILDLRPQELFAVAFPEDGARGPSPGMERIRKLLPHLARAGRGAATMEASVAAPDLRELQQRLEARFSEVLERTFADLEKV